MALSRPRSRLRPPVAARNSIRYRENQNTIVGLVGNDRQVRELVNGDAKLRRSLEPKTAPGLKWIRNGVNNGDGMAGRIDGHDASGLGIDSQRSGVDADAHGGSGAIIRIEGRDYVTSA